MARHGASRAFLMASFLGWGILSGPLHAAEPRLEYLKRLDPPVATDALLSSDGVTADRVAGEVFVCDSRRDRIVIFDARGLYLDQLNGGDAFSSPRDLAVDPQGRLVVLANHDRRPAIVNLDFDGLYLGEVTVKGVPSGLAAPYFTSVAISPSGARLYLVDSANLRLWITDREGSVSASIDLAPGTKGEKERREIVAGHVDVYGNRVLVAMPSAGEVWIYDLDGTRQGWVGRKGTSGCKLAFPVAAALDDQGIVTILDRQRMIVQRRALSGNRCLSEYLGIGMAPGMLYFPQDMALDAAGRLYVSQGFQGRVQVYDGLAPALGDKSKR